MKQKIKYFLQKYIPDFLDYLLVFKRFTDKFFQNINYLFTSWKNINTLKKTKFFDSTNLTYDQIISITFQECYSILKSSNLIFLGEIKTNSYRFLILEETITSNIYNELIELINTGYLLEIQRRGQKTEIINQNISIEKLKIKIRNFDLLRIYKVYKNKFGIIEFASKTAFEIERWYKVNGIYTTNVKNKIQNKLTFDDIQRTVEVTIFQHKVPQLYEMNKYFTYIQNNSVNEVDIVYTWVNGNDAKWLTKKSKYHNDVTVKNIHASATSENRYISRDELKYSLRSIEKYFSGYRKIFIVTDDQKPEWLIESEKISIIDHKELFPDQTVLPVFNSHAIEACLHHIEGLSEHYIYLNDDIIFGRAVHPSLFFPKKGKLSIFPSNQTFIPFGNASKDILPVDSAAINTRTLLEKEQIGYAIRKFKHTPLPQIKSILFELENKFSDELSQTRKSRFRQPTDISLTSSLLFNYAYFKNLAEIKPIRYTYINLASEDCLFQLKKSTTSIEAKRPDVFCINDGEGDLSDEVEKEFIEIMNNFLPEKSKFEK